VALSYWDLVIRIAFLFVALGFVWQVAFKHGLAGGIVGWGSECARLAHAHVVIVLMAGK
jgi:hypothetical protein